MSAPFFSEDPIEHHSLFEPRTSTCRWHPYVDPAETAEPEVVHTHKPDHTGRMHWSAVEFDFPDTSIRTPVDLVDNRTCSAAVAVVAEAVAVVLVRQESERLEPVEPLRDRGRPLTVEKVVAVAVVVDNRHSTVVERFEVVPEQLERIVHTQAVDNILQPKLYRRQIASVL